MEELAQRLQQLETQVGQQRAVIEHPQDQLMHQQKTIDADRAARTPVYPIALEPRANLVDLRVGNKPETFAGEAHEWKGWSFKKRQYISAVDEELYVELVDVEASELTDSKSGDVFWKSESRRTGRCQAMLMQLLQFPFTGDRGQASEEWERLVQQYEAQSSDTLQDTIKAAMLSE